MKRRLKITLNRLDKNLRQLNGYKLEDKQLQYLYKLMCAYVDFKNSLVENK